MTKSCKDTSSRNKVTQDLIICTEIPSDEFLASNTEAYYVLFDEDLMFDQRMKVHKHDPYSEFINELDYSKIRDESNRIWDCFTASVNNSNIFFYRYNYFNHLVPILFINNVIQKLLSMNFRRVWCSASFKSKRDIYLDLWQPDLFNQSFIEWSIYAITTDTLQALSQKPCHYAVNVKNNHTQKKKTQLILPYVINLVETSTNIVAMLLDNIFKPSFLNNKYSSRKNTKKVLIIAQPRKSAHLVSNMRKQHISYQRLSSQDFSELVLVNSGIEICLRFSIDSHINKPIDHLNDWINRSCLLHSQTLPTAFNRIFEQYANVFITDDETNPISYHLSKAISRFPGKYIVVIPEGAMSNFHQNKEDVFMLPNHKSMLRCFLGNDDLETNKVLSSPTSMVTNLFDSYICGYNTSLRFANIFGRIIKSIVKAAGVYHNKIIIYYNTPYIESHSFVPRMYCMPKHRKYKHMIELLSVLPSSRFLFICSVRGAEPALGLSQFKRIYFSNLHWSILASIADLSIVSDSSIGPEIMLIDKPVISWLPSPLITNDMFAYLDSLPPGLYRSVTSSFELLEAVSQMAFAQWTNPKFQDSIREFVQTPRYEELSHKIKSLICQPELNA